MAAELEEIKDDLGDEPQPKFDKYSITSYGADFDVPDLVKRLNEKSVIIPDFQRAYVWKEDKASRFIESLLLGLPVPGIFLARETDTNRLLVIDGQQRLETLRRFYDNEFQLTHVQPEFENRQYDDLSLAERDQLRDSFIHATIVEQDTPSNSDNIYMIFERLNTGGVSLNPQEIRNALYYGNLSKLLKELNTNKDWREIFGTLDNERMRDTELILRFLALYCDLKNYHVPLKSFLNSYMNKNKSLDSQSLDKLRKDFVNAIEVAYQALGNNAFKPKGVLNAAVFDAVMIGIARRLERGPILEIHEVTKQYHNLLLDKDFEITVEAGTASIDKLKRRIELAAKAFANIL